MYDRMDAITAIFSGVASIWIEYPPLLAEPNGSRSGRTSWYLFVPSLFRRTSQKRGLSKRSSLSSRTAGTVWTDSGSSTLSQRGFFGSSSVSALPASAASINVRSISAGEAISVVAAAVVECSGVGENVAWVEERNAHATSAAASRQTRDSPFPTLNGNRCALFRGRTEDPSAIAARRSCYRFEELEPKVRDRLNRQSPDAWSF